MIKCLVHIQSYERWNDGEVSKSVDFQYYGCTCVKTRLREKKTNR